MNTIQDRHPNFRDLDGSLFLVRCFNCCSTPFGRENYTSAVASGKCAWCGWKETTSTHEKMRTEMLIQEEIVMAETTRKFDRTVTISAWKTHRRVKIEERTEGSYVATCEGFDGQASGRSAAEALGNFLIHIEDFVQAVDANSPQKKIVAAAISLRDSGYDGPFIGPVCVPLFTAIAEYENAVKDE